LGLHEFEEDLVHAISAAAAIISYVHSVNPAQADRLAKVRESVHEII
jgi:hypothetical protein